EGASVSTYYDPLIAKVIATAESRPLAIARLVAALRDFPILGIRTNVPFLLRVLEHPRFASGDIDTAFLDREGDKLAREPDEPPPPFVDAAVAAAFAGDSASAGARPSMGAADARTGWTGPAQSASDPWQTLRQWRARRTGPLCTPPH